MFDFFDEDFPLSKKQEEQRRLAESAGNNEDKAEKKIPAEETMPELPEIEPEDNGDIVIETPVIDLSDVTIDDPDDYDDEYEDDEEPDDGYEGEEADKPAEEAPVGYDEALGEKYDDLNPAEEAAPEEVAVEAAAEEAAAVETAAEEVTEEAAAEEVAEEAPEESEADGEFPMIGAEEGEKAAEETYEETAEEAFEELAEAIIDEPETDGGGRYDEWAHIAEPPRYENIDDLHEELRSLGEKLDSMEKAVDEMEDGELPEGFDYEYDERYYSEEDTPAYKHPELYESKDGEDGGEGRPNITMSENRNFRHAIVPVPKRPEKSLPAISGKTVLKAGLAVAAAVAVVKLMGKRKK